MEDNKTLIIDEIVKPVECYESVKNENTGGVLRTIKGPVAEYGTLNRNKRKYSEKLWDNTLGSSYVKEQLRYKTLLGEANHPEGRFEVDFERVSHRIVDLVKVPSKNQINATIEILDTPLGNVLETLYESGSVIGYSSRAGGVLKQHGDYVDVDENKYSFVTFDAVPYPSVEVARPGVNESTVTRVEVSDEVHNKLKSIINESSKNNLKIVKDFIYNLRGYNFDEEISLMESKEGSENESEKKIEETAMCLLKESSVQIDKLKSTISILESNKEELIKKNTCLSSKLDESLKRISEIVKDQSSRVVFENKEREYVNTIDSLKALNEKNESELEILKMEVERYKGIEDVLESVRNENKFLHESISKKPDEVEVVIEKEVISKEVSDEVATLVDENTTLLGNVSDLKDKINTLQSEIQNLSNKNVEISEESIEKNTLLESAKKRLESQEALISGLKESLERSNLERKESIDEMIRVISNSYGVEESSVREKLPENFKKSDIHLTCESMVASNRKNHSVSVMDIKEQRDDRVSKSFFGSNRRNGKISED